MGSQVSDRSEMGEGPEKPAGGTATNESKVLNEMGGEPENALRTKIVLVTVIVLSIVGGVVLLSGAIASYKALNYLAAQKVALETDVATLNQKKTVTASEIETLGNEKVELKKSNGRLALDLEGAQKERDKAAEALVSTNAALVTEREELCIAYADLVKMKQDIEEERERDDQWRREHQKPPTTEKPPVRPLADPVPSEVKTKVDPLVAGLFIRSKRVNSYDVLTQSKLRYEPYVVTAIVREAKGKLNDPNVDMADLYNIVVTLTDLSRTITLEIGENKKEILELAKKIAERFPSLTVRVEALRKWLNSKQPAKPPFATKITMMEDSLKVLQSPAGRLAICVGDIKKKGTELLIFKPKPEMKDDPNVNYKKIQQSLDSQPMYGKPVNEPKFLIDLEGMSYVVETAPEVHHLHKNKFHIEISVR